MGLQDETRILLPARQREKLLGQTARRLELNAVLLVVPETPCRSVEPRGIARLLAKFSHPGISTVNIRDRKSVV